MNIRLHKLKTCEEKEKKGQLTLMLALYYELIIRMNINFSNIRIISI